jgi:hypothetical protein
VSGMAAATVCVTGQLTGSTVLSVPLPPASRVLLLAEGAL